MSAVAYIRSLDGAEMVAVESHQFVNAAVLSHRQAPASDAAENAAGGRTRHGKSAGASFPKPKRNIA